MASSVRILLYSCGRGHGHKGMGLISDSEISGYLRNEAHPHLAGLQFNLDSVGHRSIEDFFQTLQVPFSALSGAFSIQKQN